VRGDLNNAKDAKALHQNIVLRPSELYAVNFFRLWSRLRLAEESKMKYLNRKAA
jgi:hypothetical protein